MKTTKFFSVLSLVLIFVGVTAGFSTNFDNPKAIRPLNAGITYQVIIHPDLLTTPCNTYLVQVLDETGRLVAPAQVYVAGINKYYFNQKISAGGNENARRVAVLIEVKYIRHPFCSVSLFTLPDVKAGPFLAGHVYTFDLYPKTQSLTTD